MESANLHDTYTFSGDMYTRTGAIEASTAGSNPQKPDYSGYGGYGTYQQVFS